MQTETSKLTIMKDGKICTGFCKNWNLPSVENKKLMITERDHLGLKSEKSGKNKNKLLKAWVKSPNKKLEQQQAKINVLKRKDDGSSDNDGNAGSDEESAHNAGDSFGG